MPHEPEKIKIGGREVSAMPIEVNQATERWNEYFLEDGSVLKVKLVVKKVMRVDGEYDAEGNPVYLVQSTNVMGVNAAKNLKRPSKE